MASLAQRKWDEAIVATRRRRWGRLLALGVFIVALNYLIQDYRESNYVPKTAAAPAHAPVETIPKIALLFLTKGPMPHEQLWKRWFAAAEGLIPRKTLLNQCSRGFSGVAELEATCTALNSSLSANTIDAQLLFSVYIHAPPTFEYPLDSIWAKKRIYERIQTQWGHHSLVAATRALLAEAINDPLNQRFVLLSESDIPLYDPLTLYLQLMSETHSRVNSCNTGRDMMQRRWTDKMATKHMNASHWRKSSQWVALQRKHAEIVVADSEVIQSFEKYCTYSVDPDLGYVRDCISDEHYIPTLFAVHELEDEMDCEGWGIAAIDWGRGGAHPKSYGAQEVNKELIQRLRGSEKAGEAQKSALKQFYSCRDIPKSVNDCDGMIIMLPKPFQAIGANPVLTARKFPASTAAAVEKLMDECSDKVGLLSGKEC